MATLQEEKQSTQENHSSLPEPTVALEEPYSIYTSREKWLLVVIVAVAGLFSPLPGNVYFPAIPKLAVVFGRSLEDLNLSVTIYLAMQGASPMLWGPLSDRYGRRPLFLLCLFILIGSSLGLALCPTSMFWLLLLLRAVQAGGCASTIALGSGAVRDIASVDERGSFLGFFNLGPMLGPCIGPAIGGVLSQHLGWRSIFWFITIVASGCFLLILLFLPETLRDLVGNGSRRPNRWILGPLIPIIGRNNTSIESREQDEMIVSKSRAHVNPFRLLVYADILLTLTYTGIVYGVHYSIITTISSTFSASYPLLSEAELGLCYLPTGVGMILGSYLTGKILDHDYGKMKKRLDRNQENNTTGAPTAERRQDIPIEYIRLRTAPILLTVFVGCVIGWGWCIQLKSHIAGPLVLQVAMGYTSIAILNSTTTLMIDVVKSQSSGVVACTNLFRCSLAALLVSLIDRSTQKLGYGGTYSLLGGICALLMILIYTEIRIGPQWRMKRGTIID